MNKKVREYLKSLEQTRETIKYNEQAISDGVQAFEESIEEQRQVFYNTVLKDKQHALSESLQKEQEIESQLSEMLEIKVGNFLKSFRSRANVTNDNLDVNLSASRFITNQFFPKNLNSALKYMTNNSGRITLVLTITNKQNKILGDNIYMRKRITLPLDYKFSNGSTLRDNLVVERKFDNKTRRYKIAISFNGNINELPIKFNVSDLDGKNGATHGWTPYNIIKDCIISCAERENLRNKPTM